MIIQTHHIETYEIFLKQCLQEIVASGVHIRKVFLSSLLVQSDNQRCYNLFILADVNMLSLALAGWEVDLEAKSRSDTTHKFHPIYILILCGCT